MDTCSISRIDVVINMLTGELRNDAIKYIAPGGRYIDLAVGGLHREGSLDFSQFTDNQSYHPVDCKRFMIKNPSSAREIFNRIIEEIDNNKYSALPIDSVYDIANVKLAYQKVAE